MPSKYRPDRQGTHRGAYEKNRRRVLATQKTCGICGGVVDFSLKAPHPLAPCVDHIIPVAKGGHPSDFENLQLAHWACNRRKSDKVYQEAERSRPKIIGSRNLPQTTDWKSYLAERDEKGGEKDG